MNRTIFQLSFAAIGLAILVPTVDAADGGGTDEPTKAQLQANFYQQTTPYAGEVTRGIITGATNQFSFVIPHGFRKQAEINGKTLVLTSTSQTASLTFRIFEQAVDGKKELKTEALRQEVVGRFKDAQIVDEFTAYVESMNGPAFEVEWPGQLCKMTSRVAFVPYAGGHLEFVMQSPASEIRSYDSSFSSFLMMMRSSPIGQKLPLVEFLSEL